MATSDLSFQADASSSSFTQPVSPLSSWQSHILPDTLILLMLKGSALIHDAIHLVIIHKELVLYFNMSYVILVSNVKLLSIL